MCYSAPVSLNTFIFSLITSSYIFYRNKTNDRPLAVWLFITSLMQLFEFFMWTDYNNSKGWNNISTKLSFIFLVSQPLVLSIGLYLYGSYYKNNIINIIIIILSILLLIRLILVTKYVITNQDTWVSQAGPNCHLIWYYSKNENYSKLPWYCKYEKILFLIPLMFFLLLIRPYPLNIIYFLLGSVSLLLLRIKYTEEF